MATQLNIVVVEDNDELRQAMVDALTREGHRVIGVDCSEALPEKILHALIDLLVIDVNLPGEDGLSLALRVRQSHPEIGIVIVSARAESEQKREGYASGADIYLTKPVSLEELNAAIYALARRLKVTSVPEMLTLNKGQLLLMGPEKQSVPLNVSEVCLLSAFCMASGSRLEKWQLIEILQKESANDPVATMELVIVRLRKKIRQVGILTPSIQVIRHWGYQFCIPTKII